MDFFDILHGLLTERKFAKLPIMSPRDVRPRAYYAAKQNKYRLEVWYDLESETFYFEFIDVGHNPAPLTLDDMVMVIEQSNQVTQTMLADPDFDPEEWLDQYLLKVGYLGKMPKSDIKAEDLIMFFLKEKGFEPKLYSQRDGSNGKLIRYIRLKDPFYEHLSIFAEGIHLFLRIGQLKHGANIQIKGSLADPSNDALENLLKIAKHFIRDGFDVMKATTTIKY
jgi:hypothetical protein